jgi:hypothetical protein
LVLGILAIRAYARNCHAGSHGIDLVALFSIPLGLPSLVLDYLVQVARQSRSEVESDSRSLLDSALPRSLRFLAHSFFIHATVTGGYAFYHPVELFCIRVGSLTALLGLAARLTGRGKVRLAVTVISTLNLLLWFMDAVWQ